MDKKILFLLLVTVISLTGCATSSVEPPTFTPSMLGDSRDIALVFESVQQNDHYGVNQTPIATEGLIASRIRENNASNSAIFTKSVAGIPQYEDLYQLFMARLVDKLQADGYQTFKAKHAYTSPKFDPTMTYNGDREWVIYIEGLRIQYYATTMLSSYKPRTGVLIVPYNSKTKILYKAVLVDITLDKNKFFFPTSDGVLESAANSFEGLKQNTLAAAAEAAHVITGKP